MNISSVFARGQKAISNSATKVGNNINTSKTLNKCMSATDAIADTFQSSKKVITDEMFAEKFNLYDSLRKVKVKTEKEMDEMYMEILRNPKKALDSYKLNALTNTFSIVNQELNKIVDEVKNSPEWQKTKLFNRIVADTLADFNKLSDK